MVGFNGILDIGQAEDHMTMKDKLLYGKALQVNLKTNWLK